MVAILDNVKKQMKEIIFFVGFVLLAVIAGVGIIVYNSQSKAGRPVSETPEVGEAAAESVQRSRIDAKYKWNLADIYLTRAEFDQDIKSAREQIKSFSKLSGTMTDDAGIKNALENYYGLSQKIDRIGAYANMFFDQDTRAAEGAEMKKIAEILGADFESATSFLDPELLALSKAKLESLAANPDFKDYRMPIINRLRYKDHVLSAAEESLLAQGSIMQNAGYNIYNTFINGEIQFPEVEFSDGKKAALTQDLFTQYRQSANRGDRQLAFGKFFGTLNDYRNTFAQSLSSQVDANIFLAKARKFESAAQAALFSENIPVAVYERIIQEVGDNLPVLRRYLKLKKKILGLDEMKYSDLYAPATGGVEETVSYEQSCAAIKEALKPMGEDYLRIAAGAIDPGSGWVDVYPSQGKTNGAYSGAGAFGVHPYILMNFSGGYDSISTQIHELGHAMHSYYSNSAQLYPQAGYTTFAAEVASTFNENLLFEDRLKRQTDPVKKIALLGESLETMRTTIFRQALFSEFEYKIYQAAENKIPLTADYLSQTYLDLVKRYYGADSGTVAVDDSAGIEWAYVPHFYYDFYVYKYVSGYLAGLALSQKVIDGDIGIRDAYIEKVLKNGGARYPLEQLKDVGIDMSSAEVYEAAFAVFQKRITQLEELTANRSADGK